MKSLSSKLNITTEKPGQSLGTSNDDDDDNNDSGNVRVFLEFRSEKKTSGVMALLVNCVPGGGGLANIRTKPIAGGTERARAGPGRRLNLDYLTVATPPRDQLRRGTRPGFSPRVWGVRQ